MQQCAADTVIVSATTFLRPSYNLTASTVGSFSLFTRQPGLLAACETNVGANAT